MSCVSIWEKKNGNQYLFYRFIFLVSSVLRIAFSTAMHVQYTLQIDNYMILINAFYGWVKYSSNVWRKLFISREYLISHFYKNTWTSWKKKTSNQVQTSKFVSFIVEKNTCIFPRKVWLFSTYLSLIIFIKISLYAQTYCFQQTTWPTIEWRIFEEHLHHFDWWIGFSEKFSFKLARYTYDQSGKCIFPFGIDFI